MPYAGAVLKGEENIQTQTPWLLPAPTGLTPAGNNSFM